MCNLLRIRNTQNFAEFRFQPPNLTFHMCSPTTAQAHDSLRSRPSSAPIHVPSPLAEHSRTGTQNKDDQTPNNCSPLQRRRHRRTLSSLSPELALLGWLQLQITRCIRAHFNYLCLQLRMQTFPTPQRNTSAHISKRVNHLSNSFPNTPEATTAP